MPHPVKNTRRMGARILPIAVNAPVMRMVYEAVSRKAVLTTKHSLIACALSTLVLFYLHIYDPGTRKGAKQDTWWHYVVHLNLDIQGNRAFQCININEVSIYFQSPSLTTSLEIDVSL